MKSLTDEQLNDLLHYVEDESDSPYYNGCSGSTYFIDEWLNLNIPESQRKAVYDELDSVGIFCDCELLYRGQAMFDI